MLAVETQLAEDARAAYEHGDQATGDRRTGARRACTIAGAIQCCVPAAKQVSIIKQFQRYAEQAIDRCDPLTNRDPQSGRSYDELIAFVDAMQIILRSW